MKVRDTSRGRMYAVSSNPGCTVINGDMAVDIPAGGQAVILALDKKLIIDGDDAAKFVEVRWGTNAAVGSRPAPSWIGDVVDGLISIVGVDKFDVSYLPTENTLVVHTDRISDELSDAVTALLERELPQGVEVVRYNHNIMEISWQDAEYKYAECTNKNDMLAVNPDFCKDLTSEKEWVYSLRDMENASELFSSQFNISVAYLNMPSCTIANCILRDIFGTKNPKKVYGNWPLVSSGLYAFEFSRGLSEVDLYVPALSQANGMFHNCVLTKESALRMLNRIPAYTSGKHNMTIGIHVDHKYDVDVNLALKKTDINYEPTVELPEDVTEGKGWTLAVQWNGTPTDQAAGTFAMGTLIYAKVSELERPDGTTERHLDWGHYVTNPEEYETFRSLESAYEYFGIEDPTEEELQIEEIENA